MAEIRDVYSLDADLTGLAAELQRLTQAALAAEDALDGSAESAEAFDDALGDLNSTLKTEATTISGLNTKREALVKTQSTLNKETKTGAAVNTELANTNKKVATTAATATKANRGFFAGLVRGSRSLNTLRRSASLLNGVFRSIAGVGVFSLILAGAQALGPVLRRVGEALGIVNTRTVDLTESGRNIAQNFSEQTNKLDELFGALEQANQGSEEQAEAIRAINKQYPDLLKNGQLDITTQQGRAEAYRLATIQIAESAIAQERVNIVQQAQQEIIQKGIERTLALQRVQQAQQDLNNASILNAQQRAIALNNARAALNRTQREFIQIQEDATRKVEALNDNQGLFVDVLVNLRNQLDISTTESEGFFNSFRRGVQDFVNLTDGINQTEEALKKTDKAVKTLDRTLQDSIRARQNIERLQTQLIEDEIERRIASLELAAAREKEALVGSAEERAEQRELIERKLARDILQIREAAAQEQLAQQQRQEEELNRALEELAQNRLNFRELEARTALNNNLILLEQGRIQAIEAARKAGEDIEAVNQLYSDRRAELERETQAKILGFQIEGIEAQIEAQQELGEDTTQLALDLSKLRLELAEVQSEGFTATLDITTSDGEKPEDRLEAIVSASRDALGEVANVITTINDNIIQSLDNSIARSQSSLDTIRQNSEQFNADQLALEKERLENLERERERAVNRQKAIALVQIAIDTAIAVAKAASQTGVAAPIAIAGVIAAIAGGIAAAASVTSGAAFYDGTEYVDKEGRYPSGRDTVPAMLNKGEAVITTDKNRQYRQVISAVHNGRIPADDFNGFVSNYLRNGGTPVSIAKEVQDNIMFFPQPVDNSGLENRLAALEDAILGLPARMPGVKVQGDIRRMLKVLETRQRGREFSKNRAK